MGEWSDSRPNRFTPGGNSPPIPTGYEAGSVQDPVWTRWR